MAWTEFTRKLDERDTPRYSSDVTDVAWSAIASFLPSPNGLGRPRDVELRGVWDAIQNDHIMRNDMNKARNVKAMKPMPLWELNTPVNGP